MTTGSFGDCSSVGAGFAVFAVAATSTRQKRMYHPTSLPPPASARVLLPFSSSCSFAPACPNLNSPERARISSASPCPQYQRVFCPSSALKVALFQHAPSKPTRTSQCIFSNPPPPVSARVLPPFSSQGGIVEVRSDHSRSDAFRED